MSDNGDLNRVCRRIRILDAADYAGRRQEQDDDDENGNDRPGKLQLHASIDLGGLLSLGAALLSELHNGIDKQAENHHEYGPRNFEDKQRKVKNRLRRRGERREDIGRTQGRTRWVSKSGGRHSKEGRDKFNRRTLHAISLTWSTPDGLLQFRLCQHVSQLRLKQARLRLIVGSRRLPPG